MKSICLTKYCCQKNITLRVWPVFLTAGEGDGVGRASGLRESACVCFDATLLVFRGSLGHMATLTKNREKFYMGQSLKPQGIWAALPAAWHFLSLRCFFSHQSHMIDTTANNKCSNFWKYFLTVPINTRKCPPCFPVRIISSQEWCKEHMSRPRSMLSPYGKCRMNPQSLIISGKARPS